MEKNENEAMTTQELSDLLKEIYYLASNRKMKQNEIKKKYGMQIVEIRALLNADKKYLELEQLQEIIELIKKSKTVTEASKKVDIQVDLLRFIRKTLRLDIKDNRKKDKEKYYRDLQEIWTRVEHGERIETISRDKGICVEKSEELLYIYSKLLEDLHMTCMKYTLSEEDDVVQNLKDKYHLSDEMIECVKDNKRSANVQNALKRYLQRRGFNLENNKGGEHDEL